MFKLPRPAATALRVCALALCAVASSPSMAQEWPTKPVTLIVPFPPGGGNDIVARTINVKLHSLLGQNLIIDNHAGAGGNLALGATAKSPPDGYTIVIATSSIAVSPALYANLGYDPVKDFSPITLLVIAPTLLVVSPALPVKSLNELVALAKKHPGKLDYASAGTGSSAHMLAEDLAAQVPITRQRISHIFTCITGGSDADNAWSLSDGQMAVEIAGCPSP